jgi:hypothetical protein
MRHGCRCTAIRADVCYADVCYAYADVCYAYADVCYAYADVCYAARMQMHRDSCIYAYADVCYAYAMRMLTYAREERHGCRCTAIRASRSGEISSTLVVL